MSNRPFFLLDALRGSLRLIVASFLLLPLLLLFIASHGFIKLVSNDDRNDDAQKNPYPRAQDFVLEELSERGTHKRADQHRKQSFNASGTSVVSADVGGQIG